MKNDKSTIVVNLKRNKQNIYNALIFIFVISLGIFLRLYNLGKVSFWFDEAIVLMWTENINKILSSSQPTPPLYIFLMKVWSFFNDGEFYLRLLSALFGICSIAGIYFFGKKLFDEKTGLISAFLLTISPFNIFYSQEMSCYSLLGFLILFAIYSLHEAMETEKWKYWMFFVLFSILSFMSHYIAPLFIIAEMIYFLTFYRKHKHLFCEWIISHFLIFLFFLPWISLILKQVAYGISINIGWWIPDFTIKSFLITLKNFSIGYNALPNIFYSGSIIYYALFILGIYTAGKNRKTVLLVLIAILPLIVAGILSKCNVNIYVERYFLPCSLFYYLIVAKGISSLRNKYLICTFLLGILVLNALSLLNYYSNYLPNEWHHHTGVQRKPDYREAAEYIATNYKKDDAIIHTNANTIYSIEHYLSADYFTELETYEYFSKEAGFKLWGKWIKEKEKNKIIKFQLDDNVQGQIPFDEKSGVLMDKYDRFWIIVHQFLGDMDNSRSFNQELLKEYKELDSKRFYGVNVILYEKK